MICNDGDVVVVFVGVVKCVCVIYYVLYFVYVMMELFVVVVCVVDGCCEVWICM